LQPWGRLPEELVESRVSPAHARHDRKQDGGVETAKKVLTLMERLDDHDDVQSVSANFSIPDEAMAQLG